MTDVLSYYLRIWNLTDPEELAYSPRGSVLAVYRDSEKMVLKLFTPIGAEDESDGVLALRYFDGQGAIRVLASDERAQLIEYAGDKELAQMVTDGRDGEATEIIADVVNKLHRPRPDKQIPQLRTLRQRYSSLFNRAEQDELAGEQSIYGRGARVAEKLLANPRDECVLHGDIQHHNIRLHPVRGWLAYDPKGLYGERSFDVANSVCNPSTAPDLVMSEERLLQMTQVLADHMGVRVGRLRAFVF
jgi:streptomycin 6-kinase